MNTIDYIIKKLEELGVNDFFGVIGNSNFEIIKSIKNNSSTRWIGCVNELNAGYAADGYARIKGYGALVTTYGAGELSAINAIAGSYAENVPVICLVGVPPIIEINKKKSLYDNFIETDYYKYYEAYKNITAGFTYLTRDNSKIEIDRVLKIAVKEKKPVYIAIPSDLALNEISDRFVSYDYNSDKDCLNEVCNKIAEKIKNSNNPIIIGDSLIKKFNAEIEYKEFVSKTKIPATNFIMGLDLIDSDVPNYLGCYYSNVKNPIISKYIDDTDCLISVGAVYTDSNNSDYKNYKFNDHIAIYGNYTYVEGKRYDNVKMSDVLDLLSKLTEPKNIEIDKPNIGYKHKDAKIEKLNSDYIYPRIQEFIKENDIIFVESGLIPYGVAQIKMPANTKTEFQLSWASSGWATPASFGANIAKPSARIVLITGEGSHQMTLMEVGNMLKYGLKPIVIVINNSGYLTEKVLNNDFESDINDTVSMNYAKFARVFDGDIWAIKTETEEDFDKALKVTQIMNKMCYIEAITSKTDTQNIINELSNNKNNTNSFIINEEQHLETDTEQSVITKEYETVVHKSLK